MPEDLPTIGILKLYNNTKVTSLEVLQAYAIESYDKTLLDFGIENPITHKKEIRRIDD